MSPPEPKGERRQGKAPIAIHPKQNAKNKEENRDFEVGRGRRRARPAGPEASKVKMEHHHPTFIKKKPEFCRNSKAGKKLKSQTELSM